MESLTSRYKGEVIYGRDLDFFGIAERRNRRDAGSRREQSEIEVGIEVNGFDRSDNRLYNARQSIS